jgi:endonuclease/exonuclease/phosphatase family metal-dependent hydrolase
MPMGLIIRFFTIAICLCIFATAGAAQDRIKIATFNIQIFGVTKAGNPAVMRALADVVQKYDVVAVQEIKDVSETVPRAFKNKINNAGAAYDFLLSERTGKNPDDASSKEQYAFYYNTAIIEVMDPGGLYDDSISDHFQREPFVARFKTKQGTFTFVLIAIHTRPDTAVEEIAALEHVIKWARARYPGEDDFIALGDFNAGCEYASEEELSKIGLAGPQYIWIVPPTADTNVANSRCAYDRIVTTSGTEQDFTGAWGVDRAFTEKKVSDHWPVWAEFFVNQNNGTQ